MTHFSHREIADNLREQRKKLEDKLKAIKKIWVEHRACSGECETCDTVDWCLFLELRKILEVEG